MPTLANIQRQVKRRLLGSYREEVSSLAAAMVDTTGTTLTLTSNPTQLATGSVISIGTELMYVTDYQTSSKIATVIRGYLSDPTTHLAADLVEINSRFPSAGIYDAMTDVCNGLPLGIFAVRDSGWISIGGGQYLVDVSTASGIPEESIYGILAVLIDKPDLSASWVTSAASPTQAIRWADLTGARLVRVKYPTSSDSSKLLVRLGRLSGVQWDTANIAFRLCVRPDLSTFTPATTLTTIGLPDSMASPIVLGTVLQLWADQEVKRTSVDALGQSSRKDDVPGGLLMSDIAQMRRVFDGLVAEEAVKLRAKYPFRWTS
jgi:hypothetical protein